MFVSFPTVSRNYCIFDESYVSSMLNRREEALPEIRASLIAENDESKVVENLYILNRLLDEGVDKSKISALYPELSKFNETKSPNIQTFLAGIYRKTKIPDAFGPLVKMLIQDSLNPPENSNFDPTEEVGGAILDYLA